MNILDYKITNYSNGEIISKFINDFVNTYNCENILFVRTSTTGEWLENLLVDKKNVDRLLYYTNNTMKKNVKNIKCNKFTKKINLLELENFLHKLNKKFDLICIDPCHEYNISKMNFDLLYSFLSDVGTLISHDCFPSTEKLANPNFQIGNWCGETYVAFVEFANNNPMLYYSILNIDTGIGIISKLNINYLKNCLDLHKQEIFLSMYKNKNKDYYKYFCDNSKDLTNEINL